EHGDLRVQRGNRLRDAREPVVDRRLAQTRAEPALDGQDVDGAPPPGRALERFTGHLHERVARDPDPEAVCGSEDNPGLRPLWLPLRLLRGARKWERARGRRQPERHPRVDPVVVLAADRDLKLVARAVEVEELAHTCEWPRDRKGELALDTLSALRVLAQPLRV